MAVFKGYDRTQPRFGGVTMDGVREYAEDYAVELVEAEGRPVVYAMNEGTYNHTAVDLLDLLAWLRENRPDLLLSPSSASASSRPA